MRPSVNSGFCGCMIAVLLFNLALGGMSVNYILDKWFQTDIHWVCDLLVGLFVAELSVPAAIATWLLYAFGAF